MKTLFKLTISIMLMISLSGCNQSVHSDPNIVNIGVTDTVTSLNPLLMNGGEVTKHATGLVFLPLVELNDDMTFDYFIADSITSEDNQTFTVHVNPNAYWSDGTKISAYDIEYTVLRLCSPLVANPDMMYYAFVGVGDDGFVEEGATSIEGIKVIDENTIIFESKYPMALNTFMNSYARYLMPLPKHIIENIPEEQLTTHDWFLKPTVVSGPYFLESYDVNHYVSYVANENYFLGKPSIQHLNLRIVEGSSLYAGLRSGEIDLTHQTMSIIPQEDYGAIEALDNIHVNYGAPVTNQSLFINCESIDDINVRKALLLSIDRNLLLSGLLNNHGEIVDGFLTSVSPYYTDLQPTQYNPQLAKQYLEKSSWDSHQELKLLINSDDLTMVNAANVLVSFWKEIGINVVIETVDFATLMSQANNGDFDLMVVQYTIPPIDPYTDISWLLSGKGSWTNFSNEIINEALMATQVVDMDEMNSYYDLVNEIVYEQVPMISVYAISAIGTYNDRLKNVDVPVYGLFNDVHLWRIES